MQSIYPSGEKLYPSLFKELSQLPPHDERSYSRAKINAQFSSYQISLLHLAAIKSDYREAYFLLRMGANPNLGDYRGYTPMHHAALKGDVIMLKLIATVEKETDLSKRTQYNGTIGSLLVLNRTSPDYPFKLYEEKAGKIQEISNQRFSEITGGATPVKSMFASPEVLAALWEKIPEKKNFFEASLKDAVEAFDFQDKLFLKEISLSNGNKTYGVFCKEPIKEGQGVLIYNGEQLKDENTPDLEYKMGTVSAKKFRGLMPMVNDGPPNLAGIPAYDFLGLPKVMVFYACRNIKAGEQLFINYSNVHPVKFGSHIELDLPYTLKFFKENSLNKCIQFSAEPRAPDSPTFMKGLHHLGMLSYLFQTPTTFMQVAAEGIIKYEHLLELLKHPPLVGILNSYLSLLSFFHMTKIMALKPQFDYDPNLFPRILRCLIEAYRHLTLKVTKPDVFAYFFNAWNWMAKLNSSTISDLLDQFQKHLFTSINLEAYGTRLDHYIRKELHFHNNKALTILANRHFYGAERSELPHIGNSELKDLADQMLSSLSPEQTADLDQDYSTLSPEFFEGLNRLTDEEILAILKRGKK